MLVDILPGPGAFGLICASGAPPYQLLQGTWHARATFTAQGDTSMAVHELQGSLNRQSPRGPGALSSPALCFRAP